MNSLQTAISRISKWLETRGSYAMPLKYPPWKSVILPGAAHLARLRIEWESDNPLGVHEQIEQKNTLCFWNSFVDKEVPVYCITEELLKLFSMTDVSNIYKLIPEDWKPPILDALFVYPSGFKQADLDIVFSTCSFGKLKEIDLEQGNVSILANILTVTSYAPAPNRENCEVFQEVLNVRNSANNHIDSLLNCDKSNSFLFPIIIQCFLALSYCPELFDPFDGKEQTLGFCKKDSSENLSSKNLRPRWLGKNLQKAWHSQTNSAQSTHASPEKHWRRGHWRSQPYGKKNEDRKLVWIRPVLVGIT